MPLVVVDPGNPENEPVLGWPSGNFLCCANFVLKAVEPMRVFGISRVARKFLSRGIHIRNGETI
jgi:hypothetical protein